ncbi:MFS family permease [Deinobacterium chartae]|uniref:MFS family permease n=1 Tax=Deinobacterium chartae TaxID=521158 RepID=A0A841I5I8_9DEIO|nr:MFS transporter [Deinobacterium chartae]MBB6099539.1 MFS family permease [Deinobacterium chartae]
MMWRLLRDPRIRILWIGESVNTLGNALTFVALAWFLFRLYPDQPASSGLVMGAFTVAMLTGTLVLSSYTDVWDRRRILIVSNLLQALFIGMVPLLYHQGALSLPALVALAVLMGFTGSVVFPAQQASLPTFVPPERVQHIQALFNLTWTTSNLLAPMTAGLLVARFGAANVLALNVATLLFAVVCYLLIRFPEVERDARPDLGLRAWWERTRFGFRFVMERPALWATLLGLASVNFVMEPYTAVFLPRIADRLMEGVALPAWLGWVRAESAGALGVGILGTLLAVSEIMMVLWIGRRNNAHPLRWIALGCTVPALCTIGVAYAPSLAFAVPFAILMGVFFGPLNVMVGTLFARLTPEAVRGRVYGARILVGQGLRPAGVTLAGALAIGLGVPLTIAVLGSAAFLMSSWGYLRARRYEDASEPGVRT